MIIFFIILFFSATLYGATGQNDFPFLNISLDPRSSAMAQATTSLANGPSAIFINPSLLAIEEGSSLLIFHRHTPAEIYTDSLSFAFPLFNGTMALGLLYHYSEDITIIRNGTLTDDILLFRNISASISYARHVFKWFYSGTTFRYVTATFPDSKPQAFLLDLGTTFLYNIDKYLHDFDDIKIAISFQNILPGFNYPSKTKYVDFVFRTGISSGYKKRFIVSFDFSTSKDEKNRFSLGTELLVWRFFTIRAGYIFGKALEGLTAGAGINGIIEKGKLTFDFSYAPATSSYMNITVGINWTFSKESKDLPLKKSFEKKEETVKEKNKKEPLEPTYTGPPSEGDEPEPENKTTPEEKKGTEE